MSGEAQAAPPRCPPRRPAPSTASRSRPRGQTYSSDDAPDADNPSAGDFRALLQEALEVLRGAA
ncbi:hypothetical protein ACPB9E_29160 [Streptomyces exfoliatus]|uniref:hypothetical protein n=1 Tax=Streptomyces exfoliatus TaxID=1905 RepID=UPI003C2D55C3